MLDLTKVDYYHCNHIIYANFKTSPLDLKLPTFDSGHGEYLFRRQSTQLHRLTRIENNISAGIDRVICVYGHDYGYGLDYRQPKFNYRVISCSI